MRSKSMLIWVGTALLGLVVSGIAACGGSGDTGGSGCTPGAQAACACPGAPPGVQVCADDGKKFLECQCGGTGGAGSSSSSVTSSSSGQMGSCGDGVQQQGECDIGSEFYCPKDCMDAGTCAGHVYYATMVANVPSVWVSGGMTGLAAGDDMCVKLNMGADHVCDYTEVLAAEKNGELKNIVMATTAWVQRTTTAMVGGAPSPAGPGGRCNDWTYGTNHRSDGEYITFDTVGVPSYHLDNDTVYDPNSAAHVILGDLECGGVMRNILCCYQRCQ